MQETSQLTEFGKVFIFIIMGVVLVLVTFFISRLLAPNKPTPEKLISYECGEDPEGNSWLQFNPRFYVIALVFLLFDVEMAFIFPWTTVFGQKSLIAADMRWGWFSLSEMFVFVGILILGLVYVWKKGDLEWIRPVPKQPKVDTAIPLSIYGRINNEKYHVKSFSQPAVLPVEEKSPAVAPLVNKPLFKPTLRKPAQK